MERSVGWHHKCVLHIILQHGKWWHSRSYKWSSCHVAAPCICSKNTGAFRQIYRSIEEPPTQNREQLDSFATMVTSRHPTCSDQVNNHLLQLAWHSVTILELPLAQHGAVNSVVRVSSQGGKKFVTIWDCVWRSIAPDSSEAAVCHLLRYWLLLVHRLGGLTAGI